MKSSRLKAAFIAPCIGVGGADVLMMSLTKHAYNIEWVGIATLSEVKPAMINYVNQFGCNTPIHSVGPGFIPHKTKHEACMAACKEADIVVSWCVPKLKELLGEDFKKPIIDYIQNEDTHAINVLKTNANYVDYFAACSEEVGKKLLGVSFKYIPNAVDPGRVSPRKGRDLQRKIWGITPEQKVILFCGRLVQEKHPEDLLRAIAGLPDEYVGVYVGKGSQESNIYTLAQSIAPNRIGFIPQTYHIGDALAASDCYLLKSDFEGLPLAWLEAMLAGVPTVHTDFTSAVELHFRHGAISWMLPKAAGTKELCQTIIEATTENEEQFMRLNSARAVAWTDYTITRVAEQWEEYIEACLFDYWRKRRLNRMFVAGEREIMKGATPS